VSATENFIVILCLSCCVGLRAALFLCAESPACSV